MKNKTSEKTALEAAEALKYFCKFWRGTPYPARCKCCFRVVDADGMAMCMLSLCEPGDWSISRGLRDAN